MSDIYVYGSIVLTCLIVMGLFGWLMWLLNEYSRIQKESHHSSVFLENHARLWFWFSLSAGAGALVALSPIVLITFIQGRVLLLALVFPLLCFLMMRVATKVYNDCMANAKARRTAELRFG